MWWAIVTLTTVGYGDIVPETTTGRIAAVMIMLTGVAVLGLLAGTLASFFRLQPPGPPTPASGEPGTVPTTPASGTPESAGSPPGLEQVITELTELRAQVAALTDLKTQLVALTTHLGTRGGGHPAGGETFKRADGDQ